MNRLAASIIALALLCAGPAWALGPANGGGGGGSSSNGFPTPIATPATNAYGVTAGCTTSNYSSCASNVNIYTVRPWHWSFFSAATPTGSAIVGVYACDREVDLPQNFTGNGAGTFPLNVSASVFSGTPPGTADTYTINGTGSSGTTLASLGTIVLPTANSTPPTLTGANACASGTCVACVAGGSIDVVAPGTLHAEANFSITLSGEEQAQ